MDHIASRYEVVEAVGIGKCNLGDGLRSEQFHKNDQGESSDDRYEYHDDRRTEPASCPLAERSGRYRIPLHDINSGTAASHEQCHVEAQRVEQP